MIAANQYVGLLFVGIDLKPWFLKLSYTLKFKFRGPNYWTRDHIFPSGVGVGWEDHVFFSSVSVIREAMGFQLEINLSERKNISEISLLF